jgi:hypothetical protein
MVFITTTYTAILYQDDFSVNSISKYRVYTRAIYSLPANWSIVNQEMVESSNASDAGTTVMWLGTEAVFGDSQWTNIKLSVDLKGSDNDGMGVVFRYIDSTNHYRLRWDTQKKMCRIEKMANGIDSAIMLDNKDGVLWSPNIWYHVEVVLNGNWISAVISGGNLASPVTLNAMDTSYSNGKAGLYQWANQSTFFDNIMVTDLAEDTIPPAAISDLTLSQGSNNGTIILSFTTPGDDSLSGVASAYDIRYSINSIDNISDFLAATPASYIPQPDSALTTETIVIAGLNPDSVYYVSIRTADELNNWSGLSNSVSQTPYFDPNKQWYKGQIHCHTTNSDGQKSPDEVAAMYKAAGYDFLAISDHNTVTPTALYRTPTFLTFPNDELGRLRTGTEIVSHLNALNLSGSHPAWTTGSLQELIDLALNANAIPQINHPHWSGNPTSVILATSGAVLMEIMNYHDNLAYNLTVWDSVLSAGRQIYGTGTDDAHGYVNDFNKCWIVVRANSLTLDEIIGAIKAGDFYASSGITLTDIVMENRELCVDSENGDSVTFIGKYGEVLHQLTDSSACYMLPDSGLYIRARVANSSGELAFTQAYFPDTATTETETIGRGRVPQLTLNTLANPFSSSTIIKYTIPGNHRPWVTLKVYNSTGRIVKTLVHSRQSSGDFRIRWDGCDNNGQRVGNGVYLVGLSINNRHLTSRVIQIR